MVRSGPFCRTTLASVRQPEKPTTGVDQGSRISYFVSMKAILSEKGQVTVPKACRTKLGLKPGMKLDFQAENGVLVARKVQHEDPFHKWRGKGRLPVGSSVDEYIDGVRG